MSEWRCTCLAGLLALAGCGDDEPSETPVSDTGSSDSTANGTAGDDAMADSAPGDGTTEDGTVDGDTAADESTGEDAPGFRDTRYCEVLPVYMVERGLQVDVFNSLGHSDCPQQAWDALDAMVLAAELEATAVVLNGPRHFLMDTVAQNEPTMPEVQVFGELTMSKAATLMLPVGVPTGAYEEREVNRDTTFTFEAGAPIFELTGPDGGVYVMQSYSLQVDPEQTLDTLGSLGERLQPAEGWAFTTRVLEAPLQVMTTDGVARVVQDELDNTYQRHSG